MAARKTRLSVEWRDRIKSGELMSRLESHALGLVDMKPTEIRAAEILLRKALPDLATMQHTGEISVKSVKEMTREELLAIAGSRSERAAIEGRCEEVPADVH